TGAENHQLMELEKIMKSKDFPGRTERLVLLLDHCERNPEFISNSIVQVFDVLVPRLQDSHKKVKQKALEVLASMIPLLKGALQSALPCIIKAVMENLKDSGIHAAA
ncbi:TGRM2 protein, partial [Turnix velox]|nr:TGRM2 protein [Turnix velox]